jgi:E3 Ubiquitin ligase
LADSSDLAFQLLWLGAAIAGGGWFAFRWLHLARMVEDTPTSRIRSAAQGYVELAGRCRTLAGTPNLAPLTQRPCVWWRYRIQRRTGSGSPGKRRTAWSTIRSGRSAQPFLLDDGTGECIVQPDGAEVLTGERTTWYGETPWPTQIPGRVRLRTGDQEYRYTEERIYEHERIYVLGAFHTHDPALERDLEAGISAQLAEWKRDQAALVARFDRDRDGRISLEEWEQAREEARRSVVEEHLDRPATAARHVLGRPDGGRLFVIAAFEEGVLARRYRRRALAAFAGFVAAVYVLGWLLQGMLGKA